MAMDLINHSIYDEVYELSPKSLREICLDSIITDINKLTTFTILNESSCTNEYRKDVFFVQNMDIPCRLAESLLEKLSEKGMINNDTLSIFSNSSQYHLRTMKLPEINMKLGGQELRNFSTFRLKHLALGFTGQINLWSIRKLRASFAASRESLTSLMVNIYPAVKVQSGTMFDFFVQFPNLTNLHYDSPILDNHLTFTVSNWSMLFDACTQLKVLYFNINGSNKEVQLDSTLFLKCKNLQSLTLRSAFKSEAALQSVKCIQSFIRMESLRYIDFSIDSDPTDAAQPFQFRGETDQVDVTTHQGVLAKYVNTFLRQSQASLSELESLDLSGIFRVSDRYIQEFLETHQHLRFLGLCMVNTKFCMSKEVAREHSHVTIAGCFIEEQIIMSLLKYSNRRTYMREVLKGLFQVSATWSKRRPYVVKKVLEIICNRQFRTEQPIMLAATACIFHLSKEQEDIPNELNVVLLSEIAQVTGGVLVRFLGSIQMVKNCLLIICTDRILQNATFDRVAMCRLCLQCMMSHGEGTDAHVTRMAVAIISILACRISSEETANLVSEHEMKLLLDIVQVRIDTLSIDSTLKFNLSALWNITDESPAASKLFFDLNGIQKYARMLEVFAGDTQIEQRVLGLINNIAEVKFLREVLVLNEDLIKQVKKLVSSTTIAVSYFACGIVANLSLTWDEHLTCLTREEKDEAVEELQIAIDRFGVLPHEIVTYRSFKPFYELLECHAKPEVQHWAVWAIHHVCTLNTEHYKTIMSVECMSLLEEIEKRTESEQVKTQIHSVQSAMKGFDDVPNELSMVVD